LFIAARRYVSNKGQIASSWETVQYHEVDAMQTIKLRQLGNTQSLRLPEAFFIPGSEVKVYREGSRVILEPVAASWNDILEALDSAHETVK